MSLFAIPSHCEAAVVFDTAIMLVFSPIVIPFYYSTVESDAEDFFDKYCGDCSLRGTNCRISGAYSGGNCKLNNHVNRESVTRSVQMPVPRHVLFFGIYEEPVRFGYETTDGIKALRLSNIYPNGQWCRGDVRFMNRDPSAIYNGYFGSIHNHDLTSARPYKQYLKDLESGVRQIEEDEEIIDIGRWGSARALIENPTRIEWAGVQDEGYLRIKGYDYAKIS